MSDKLVRRNESQALISPEDIKKYDELRKLLQQRQEEIKKRKTPKDQIKQKGKYDFAEWSYMLKEMDELHPLRAERLIGTPQLLSESLVFTAAVEVTDLLTGEVRIGCDAQPVIAYDENSDKMKNPKTVRELMGNALKGAITKALRNAYSNFGICADLYDSVPDLPPTEEQKLRYQLILESLDFCKKQAVELNKLNLQVSIVQYKNKIEKGWETQYDTTADIYLTDIQEVIDSRIKPHLKPTQKQET